MNIEVLEKIGLKALRSAYMIHEELGAKGEELVEKNRFGDMSLVCDIEAEKAVIDVFRDENVPIKIISEEHGIVIIGDNPKYLAVLDGIDGSAVYKKLRSKGRYGTMLGIFSNIDPIYDDYLFSGVMEHATNKLFYATKNSGAFVVKDNILTQIHSLLKNKIDTNSKIYIDEYFDINKEVFSSKLKEYNTLCLCSSCVYYVDVSSGEAILALECTRKNNLEIAVAYGLIIESGGVMMSTDKIGLGKRKYYEFGQDSNIPVVTASSEQLAFNLIDCIK